jgi:DNA-binding transcriptional LysR family regulator
MFDWNDLRFSRVAAQRTFVDRSPTLEHDPRHRGPAHRGHRKSLGTALFVQHAQGYELTPAGEALLKHAEAMENVALLARRKSPNPRRPWARSGRGHGRTGHHVPGQPHEWPVRTLSGLEVELVAVPRFVSILNREAEISIHLERPAADMLVTRKLTDYRLALYASQDT